jgi:phosphatidylserine decarboxylase
MGMIKFGSTTELILPASDEVDIRVALGDQVRGGRTVLAAIERR